MVELMRLYSNLQDQEARLRELVTAASSQRPTKALHRPRQHQHRLSAGEVAEVIAGYAQRESIKQLAMRFAFTEPPLRHSSAAMTSHRQAVDDAVELVPRHIENDWLV